MNSTRIVYGELSHHGILGMKWGVRRFQKKDGTRTPLGKKRREEPTHDELMKSTDPKLLYKYRDKLSDQELREKNNRLNMEKQMLGYKNDQSALVKGERAAGAVLAVVGTATALYNLKNNAIVQSGLKAFSKLFAESNVRDAEFTETALNELVKV